LILGCSSGVEDVIANGKMPLTPDPFFSENLIKLWIGSFVMGDKQESTHIMASKKQPFITTVRITPF